MNGNRKLSKTTLTFWQDLVTFVLFIAAAITAFTNTELHIWLSVGMLLTTSIHLYSHRKWLGAMLRRKPTKKRRPAARLKFKLVLDMALLLVFVSLVGSGVLVSLIYAPNVSAFHNAGFYLFTGLTSLHLALNWAWIVKIGRKTIITPFRKTIAQRRGGVVA